MQVKAKICLGPWRKKPIQRHCTGKKYAKKIFLIAGGKVLNVFTESELRNNTGRKQGIIPVKFEQMVKEVKAH